MADEQIRYRVKVEDEASAELERLAEATREVQDANEEASKAALDRARDTDQLGEQERAQERATSATVEGIEASNKAERQADDQREEIDDLAAALNRQERSQAAANTETDTATGKTPSCGVLPSPLRKSRSSPRGPSKTRGQGGSPRLGPPSKTRSTASCAAATSPSAP